MMLLGTATSTSYVTFCCWGDMPPPRRPHLACWSRGLYLFSFSKTIFCFVQAGLMNALYFCVGKYLPELYEQRKRLPPVFRPYSQYLQGSSCKLLRGHFYQLLKKHNTGRSF